MAQQLAPALLSPAAICDSGLEVSLGMRGKLTVFSIAATATWSSSWWGNKIGMGGASGLAWTELENDLNNF